MYRTEKIHDGCTAVYDHVGHIADFVGDMHAYRAKEYVAFLEGKMPQCETVRCRIAVAMGATGLWGAYAFGGKTDDELIAGLRAQHMIDQGDRISFVEADVPKPAQVTIQGTVQR